MPGRSMKDPALAVLTACLGARGPWGLPVLLAGSLQQLSFLFDSTSCMLALHACAVTTPRKDVKQLPLAQA